jgi:nucleotide-binding universal stress UspA family protein
MRITDEKILHDAAAGNPRPAKPRPNQWYPMTRERRATTMAKRILAPIDGREESTTIVPVVAALARGAGSTIRLLKVFPVPERVMGPHGRTVAYVDQEMARLTALGLDELAHVEAELEGIPVERVVRFGEPAEEIRLEAEAFNADLVTLAAARRGRLASALRPGVADRVVEETPIPTLVLRG